MTAIQTLKTSMKSGNGRLLYLSFCLFALSFILYEVVAMDDNISEEKRNMIINFLARLILVGLGFTILGFEQMLLTAHIFRYVATFTTAAIVVLMVFVEKLPIWEEK